MPLTQLDPTAALIVIDLQKGIVAIPTAHPAADIVSRASQLAAAFRSRNLPVVLVNVTAAAPGRTDTPRRDLSAFPADWTDLAPELNPQPTDHRISKQRFGAFIGTDLNEYLRQRSVTQVFIVGISTSVGVESTARSAFDHGYNVVIVTDATTDRDLDSHLYCIEKIFPRLAETTTTETALAQLSN
jgi:nicotinamidase-related amidase